MDLKKVVVSLYGGLGNQLFQYAAGRALAARTHAKLVLDLAWFDEVHDLPNTTIRKFALAPFKISAIEQKVGINSLARFGRIGRILQRGFQRVGLGKLGIRVYSERAFCFDPSLNSLDGSIWLNGYWQSYKYFQSIADIIRNEIGSAGVMSESSKRLYAQIKNSDSICVHIRRGDYLTNEAASQTHGLCGLEYYVAGLEIASRNLANPHCYVFSDDPDWVRTSFSVAFPMTVVDVNGPDDAHQDLWLMAACKRFVIANSSLSWWGGWLSDNAEKVVVAPSRWFLSESHDTKDLIPDDWVRI